MTKIKAFIFAGDKHQYAYFIKENHLDYREYPALTEDNWQGRRGVDVIRTGTYFDKRELLDRLPYIEGYLRRHNEYKES